MAVPVSSPADLVDSPRHRLAAIRVLRNRALATLMLGHFTVDMYVGVIPMLYPLLRDKFDLSLETVGYVSLAYGGAASLSQPHFGLIARARAWSGWRCSGPPPPSRCSASCPPSAR
jgi:predicted MFS family arabinose efflux permease